MKRYVLFFMLLCYGVLFAEVLEVPEDYSTIQEAFEYVAEDDTVLVAPGVYYENIVFPMVSVTLCSWYEISQNSNYIYSTIIDGGRLDCVVFAGHGKLSGFTIRNGFSSSVGGIYDQYGNFEMENLIVENNESLGSSGGIRVRGSGNQLKNSIIRNNVSGNRGGGIRCQYCELFMEGVSIYGNTAVESGGGMDIFNSEVTFSTENLCSIYCNNGSGRNYGSEIACDLYEEIILDTFTVMSPTAYHAYPLENFNFSINHSVYSQVYSDLFVSPDGNNQNSGISADEPLKTISCAFSRIIPDSLLSQSIFLANGVYSLENNGEMFPVCVADDIKLIGESEDGVILDADHSGCLLEILETYDVEIYNMTLQNGDRTYGGGIYCAENSQLYLENVTIKDNYARSSGGAIHCSQGGKAVLQNVLIFNNSSGEGGGIYSRETELEIYNSDISHNNCLDDYDNDGGGIYQIAGSLIIENSSLENNHAMRDGGGIYCIEEIEYRTGTEVTFESVTFHENGAMQNGGGLYIIDSFEIEMIDVAFTGNYAADLGGGIFSTNCELNNMDGIFSENIANKGGGVYFSDTFAVIERACITNNYSGSEGGGLWIYNFSVLHLLNSTIADNYAASFGGGIFCYQGATLYTVNSVIWGNSLRQIYAGGVGAGSILIFGYCDIEDGEEDIILNNNNDLFWLDGNIETDPLFVDPEENDYSLMLDSPCIDTGVDYLDINGYVLIDVNEDEYIGLAPDMGAFEYSATEIISEEVPVSSTEISNYPNPFNPETVIFYNIKDSGKVSLNIYDIKGRLVRRLVDNYLENGEYRRVWDGKGDNGKAAGSGIYFAKLSSISGVKNHKLMLIK